MGAGLDHQQRVIEPLRTRCAVDFEEGNAELCAQQLDLESVDPVGIVGVVDRVALFIADDAREGAGCAQHHRLECLSELGAESGAHAHATGAHGVSPALVTTLTALFLRNALSSSSNLAARHGSRMASRAAAIGTLTASLAHELNQPLGAIAVNSTTLMRWLDKKPPDLQSAYKTAERMERDGKRASEIIKNTRAHLARGKRVLVSTCLDEIIRSTLVILEQELERQRITVRITTAPGLPDIDMVRIEIQQVLINLITNAMQALEHTPNGEIQINVGRANARELYVTIRDNGPGLPQDLIRKLSNPFFTTKQDGLGLGLSICQSLIEAHSGSLFATNQSDGGAKFEARLPLKAT